MFEKVNPSHPDKIADRIAGAIVDLAYKKNKNPKVACEVLIGHGKCYIINETNVHFSMQEISEIVYRIAYRGIGINYVEAKQDKHLAKNQSKEIKCGDNGIFKGIPVLPEQQDLTYIVQHIYEDIPYDGKYIISDKSIVACQSNVESQKLLKYFKDYSEVLINPLGDWTGGTNVDAGATNRKLGSDMGNAVTGGGLHGKDLSKADVSVNIICHMLADVYRQEVKAYCAIGDKNVWFYIGNNDYTLSMNFKTIVREAKKFIKDIGGFEKLAEWGLIR